MSIPSNSTITDTSQRLVNPVEYVPAVYGKLHRAHKNYPFAVVRIGCTGEGKFPNYRIEDGHGVVVCGPFNGQSHGDLTNAGNPEEENWSSNAMTHSELKTLLQQVRQGTL